MKLSDLRPNEGQIEGVPSNPRTITEDDFEKLKKSLVNFRKMLSLRPMVVDEDWNILGGNMRYQALCRLRDEGVEGFTEDIPDEWVRQDTTLTAAEKREFVIKDNQQRGRNDWDALANEWDDEELREWDVEAAEWGADSESEDDSKQVDEDDFDEDNDKVETICKQGDIWQLGAHRLMCGDSTKEYDAERLMNGELATMFITDPPYGVSYTDKNEFLNSIDASQRLTNAIQNDSHKPEEMEKFWVAAFSIGYNFTKERMSYYITAPQGGDLLLLLLLLQAIRTSGFALKHSMVWNKNNHVLGRCDYNYKHEPIIYGWKQKGTHDFYGKGKFKTSVWDIPKPLKNDLHPTMKPVALIENMLLNNSIDGDIVLDLFGGSGTTLIACEQLNRRCYMMELDPHYCDVIIARWEKLTGEKAVLINRETNE